MRRGFHYLLGLTLASASVVAPFAHVHEEGRAERHVAEEHFAVLHTHIPLPSHEAEMAEADLSARPFGWFRFELAKRLVVAPPPAVERLAPPPARPSWVSRERSRPAPEVSPPRHLDPRGPPSLHLA